MSDSRLTEDAWALNTSWESSALCGCRARISPKLFEQIGGALDGDHTPVWMSEVWACNDHEHDDLQQITGDVARQAMANGGDAYAVLGSILERMRE